VSTTRHGLVLAALLVSSAWADAPPAENPTPAPTPAPTVAPTEGPIVPPAAPSAGLSKWFNPATAPFIPIPSIGTDPNSGTTVGVIPTWIQTDDQHEIRRIIAPDLVYNPDFGWGAHGRVYGYTSGDEQWSVVGGVKERVEREFDAEFQHGRLREGRWSVNTSLIYDRDGTPRFFGIGNESPVIEETNYTAQQEEMQVQVGFNLTHAWQLQYTARLEIEDVLPGTLSGITSIQNRFGRILGVGVNRQVLNRLAVVYDTRDDLVIPKSGVQMIAYGGLASRAGLLNDSMYSEAGGDGRAFWPVAPDTVLAAHSAIRYLPTSHSVPFWALSSVGGDESVVGGQQPLRGFGDGRFYDRDSFSSSVELRRKVATFAAASSSVDLELTPFIDVGRVFARNGTFPLDQLHHVYGLGFRGVARPFVVGYVDIGYGDQGVAAFTGLNYPF
jgi:hypothetical protein